MVSGFWARARSFLAGAAGVIPPVRSTSIVVPEGGFERDVEVLTSDFRAALAAHGLEGRVRMVPSTWLPDPDDLKVIEAESPGAVASLLRSFDEIAERRRKRETLPLKWQRIGTGAVVGFEIGMIIGILASLAEGSTVLVIQRVATLVGALIAIRIVDVVLPQFRSGAGS